MIIREYKSFDCRESAELFFNTVHSVNAADYTKEQLDAWAPESMDLEKWDSAFLEHYSIAAFEDGVMIGFGDIDIKTGYLDRLFVHRDYQRRGVAAALCDKLEQSAGERIFTHASITAKPFFEKRGYKVLKRQSVERRGVWLDNFVMEKRFIK